ncbi:MAG: hypothetical protein Q7J28_03050 [Caulobacter sp.]|nr:hypothetical protein [Caulobacter sp.]
MTTAPDPAELSPPTDPARYGRRRAFGVAFWAVLALVVVVFAVGVGGARLWPRISGAAPAEPASGVQPVLALPDLGLTRPAAPPPAAPAPLEPSAEITALQARVAALEAGQTRTVNAAAAALAAASLAEATQGSGPFDAELAALERLMPLSAEVRALKPFAEGGAPSRAALAAEFDAAAAKASIAARDPGETGGFLARLRHALSSIVTIRQVGSTTGDAPDAVLARADAAVAEGDIAGALTLLRALPPKSAQAMAPWQSRALQRVAVDRQVAAIRSRAISDLVDVTREQP